MSFDVSVAEHFLTKIRLDDACHIWTARLDQDGYGTFSYQGRQRLAHRLAYQWANGPIPEGLELDHTCRNRA